VTATPDLADLTPKEWIESEVIRVSSMGWLKSVRDYLWIVTHPHKAILMTWLGAAAAKRLRINPAIMERAREEKSRQYDAEWAARQKAKRLQKYKRKARHYASLVEDMEGGEE